MAKLGKLIGRGTFSKVYRDGNSDFVTIVSSDTAKECAALFPVSSDCFPTIERIEYDVKSVYRMEYLSATRGLKPHLSAHQWGIYKALRKSVYNLCMLGYDKIVEQFQKLPDCEEKEALIKFAENYSNYCKGSMRFEISPRNVRVKNGKLVFLDCFFCAESLRKSRKKW